MMWRELNQAGPSTALYIFDSNENQCQDALRKVTQPLSWTISIVNINYFGEVSL